MLPILLSILVAVAIGFFLFMASRRPDEFRVTRSVLIAASPDAIFPYIDDVRKNQEWSPWVAMEPDADYKFEGPRAGVGATVRWDGKKTGAGAAIIVESRANELVKTRLEFLRPMVSTNFAEIALAREEGKTRVTWTMYGPNNFASKCFSMIVNCEKMVGKQFEQGLASLRDIVEQNILKAA